jgi:hypothetical protein
MWGYVRFADGASANAPPFGLALINGWAKCLGWCPPGIFQKRSALRELLKDLTLLSVTKLITLPLACLFRITLI